MCSSLEYEKLVDAAAIMLAGFTRAVLRVRSAAAACEHQYATTGGRPRVLANE